MPFFSVIIPTHNRRETLGRALKSVMEQTFNDYEIIVVDDASTDDTKKYLENFNVKLISFNENKGVSIARNEGAKVSSGEYLAFLDSDDAWEPRKLEEQYNLLKMTGAKLVHSNELWVHQGTILNQQKKHEKGGGDQFKRSCELCVISPSAASIKKETFFELGGFREDFIVCEDYDLWLKYTSLYECAFSPDVLVTKYGGHKEQLSTKYFAMDYYRIKSLDFILKNRDLSHDKKLHAKTILLKKGEQLLKGYKKHNNLKDYDEILKIYNSWAM